VIAVASYLLKSVIDFKVGLSLAHSQPWNVGVHQVLSVLSATERRRVAPRQDRWLALRGRV